MFIQSNMINDKKANFRKECADSPVLLSKYLQEKLQFKVQLIKDACMFHPEARNEAG